jgi:hypothetical protein
MSWFVDRMGELRKKKRRKKKKKIPVIEINSLNVFLV